MTLLIRIASLTSLIVLVLSALTHPAAGVQFCPHDGDVTQDGNLTQRDAQRTLQYFLGNASVPPDACELDRADVQGPRDPGAVITPADVVCIARRFLGLRSCLDNTPPVADAGHPQTVSRGTFVRLDGSGSSDGDGDVLSFMWELLARPEGSAAELSDPISVQPLVFVDVPGDYIARLMVSDGSRQSPPALVTVSTRNAPPVAEAGPAQTVPVGTTVQLDGRGSEDTDGDPLAFQWTLLEVPEGSTAALAEPTRANPTVVTDRPGYYAVQLVVNDGRQDSMPDVVVLSTRNSRPVAEAGAMQTVRPEALVQLDSRDSHDADGDLR